MPWSPCGKIRASASARSRTTWLALRRWATKIGKPDIVPKDNAAFDIGRRSLVATESKAWELKEAHLAKVSDEYVCLSLRLQAAFGLRRKEAINFSPNYAIKNDHIKLKANWTKGGRARTVPILNDEQRQLLEEVKKLAKGGALIPPDQNYIEQQNHYDAQVRAAGIRNPHGLRHAYAQRRYEELTDWKAPVAGGPASTSLTKDQRARDKGARENHRSRAGPHSRAHNGELPGPMNLPAPHIIILPRVIRLRDAPRLPRHGPQPLQL